MCIYILYIYIYIIHIYIYSLYTLKRINIELGSLQEIQWCPGIDDWTALEIHPDGSYRVFAAPDAPKPANLLIKASWKPRWIFSTSTLTMYIIRHHVPSQYCIHLYTHV